MDIQITPPIVGASDSHIIPASITVPGFSFDCDSTTPERVYEAICKARTEALTKTKTLSKARNLPIKWGSK